MKLKYFHRRYAEGVRAVARMLAPKAAESARKRGEHRRTRAGVGGGPDKGVQAATAASSRRGGSA